MTREEFEHKQYNLSVGAGMNQRYHQEYAARHELVRQLFVTVTIGLVCVSEDFPTQLRCALWLASVFIALALWEAGRSYGEMFRRWCDYREQIDDLELETGVEATAEMVVNLKRAEAKFHRIGALEPAPNAKLLIECQKAEHKSRHPAVYPDETGNA